MQIRQVALNPFPRDDQSADRRLNDTREKPNQASKNKM